MLNTLGVCKPFNSFIRVFRKLLCQCKVFKVRRLLPYCALLCHLRPESSFFLPWLVIGRTAWRRYICFLITCPEWHILLTPHIQLVRTNNMLYLGTRGTKKCNPRMNSFILSKLFTMEKGMYLLWSVSPLCHKMEPSVEMEGLALHRGKLSSQSKDGD